MERKGASRSQRDAPFPTQLKNLSFDELPMAADLLAEGMGDNPTHIRVFGGDPIRRQRRLQRFLRLLVAHVHSRGMLLGAYADGELIGVLGMMAPGRCRPGRIETLRFAGTAALTHPPATVLRIRRWLTAWARNDPAEPHWHLGPMAVRPAQRRQGVARRLMTQCCEHIDAQAGMAWLETDMEINVAFYETLGFSVDRQEKVIGARNWFMARSASET